MVASRISQGKSVSGRLRCAIFGTGYWSTLQIPCWMDRVEIVACYNRTRSKAEVVAKRFGIPLVYDQADDLMEAVDFDFADIITEVPVHEEICIKAFDRGIPVICQKPMSYSLASCRRMVAAAERNNVPFFIHENFRWQQPFRQVKNVLGQLGQIIKGKIQLGSGGEQSYITQPFLRTLPHPAITDMGPHLFDLCRFLFGEIDSLYAVEYKKIDSIGGCDTLCVLARCGDTPVVLEICEFVENRVFIEGKDAVLILNPQNRLLIQTKAGKETYIEMSDWPRVPLISEEDWYLHGGDCINSIYQCNMSFLEAFKSGVDPDTVGKDNINSMKVVFAAVDSVTQNRVINVREL